MTRVDPSSSASMARRPTTLPAPPSELRVEPAGVPAGIELAGFGRRLAARGIDYLIVSYLLTLALLGGAAAARAWDSDCSVLACRTWEAVVVALGILAVAAYEVVLTTLLGGTLGKRAVGISVVGTDGDSPPRAGRATLRLLVLAAVIVALPLFVVSLIVALRSPLKQMWHDRAASTIVVRTVRERGARRWLRIVGVATVILASIVFLGYLMNQALPNQLIDVRFQGTVEPFEVGENGAARYELVDGTYRIMVKGADEFATSLGDFPRTAYAVGVRAEVIEITDPGLEVAVECRGPGSGGGDELAGYAFHTGPGGDFVLVRLDPGGGAILEDGTDGRIGAIRRVSILCEPGLDGNVSVTGFVNGFPVAMAEDQDGYDAYTYAGLTVRAERAFSDVRFTRVWARVPDREWAP